jgi:Lrp/AsnC family leucine-responsive transcriptional regulator
MDRFDLALLDAVQRDDGRTAESLARDIPLSPSAIARRLRRLRADGWVERTIALLSPRLTSKRLQALVHVQLDHHSARPELQRLRDRLAADEAVQWAAEISGGFDIALLVDQPDLDRFGEWAEDVLAASAAVRRYETSIIKRPLRFAPFVALSSK